MLRDYCDISEPFSFFSYNFISSRISSRSDQSFIKELFIASGLPIGEHFDPQLTRHAVDVARPIPLQLGRLPRYIDNLSLLGAAWFSGCDPLVLDLVC